MDNKRKMNQSEMLAAIADAVKRKQAGEDIEVDPNIAKALRARMQPGNPEPEEWAPNIAPPKPDPEANVQRMIEQRVQQGAKINPETGMPFYTPPAEQAVDPQEEERRAIRMRMLQEAAKSGQVPGYMKKL